MKQAIGYVRVSSKEQRKSGFGIEKQKAEIKKFAEANNFHLLRIVEEAASGIAGDTSPVRPLIREALSEAKRHQCPLIVSNLNRVSRSLSEAKALIEASGVSIHSIRDGVVTATNIDALYAGIEKETAMLKERTKLGAIRAKASGVVFGNTKNLTEAQKLGAAVNAKNAERNRLALSPYFEECDRLDIRSARDIADYLNSRGILTARGLPWTSTNVSRMKSQKKGFIDPDVKSAAEHDEFAFYRNDPDFGAWS